MNLASCACADCEDMRLHAQAGAGAHPNHEDVVGWLPSTSTAGAATIMPAIMFTQGVLKLDEPHSRLYRRYFWRTSTPWKALDTLYEKKNASIVVDTFLLYLKSQHV